MLTGDIVIVFDTATNEYYVKITSRHENPADGHGDSSVTNTVGKIMVKN